MSEDSESLPFGLPVSLPGHFDVPVVLEGARPLARGFECRVRLPDGTLDEAEKTKRYQLAEHLAAQPAGHVLLLTATPHHGGDDRFAHFIRLLDPDLFPEPHRNAAKAGELRRDILSLGPDCPWALRRLKEDLKDLQGNRLFPDRNAHTITFKLSQDEYDLYKAVTAYINDFLPHLPAAPSASAARAGASGRRKASVALARTVLQRRLASSTMAIFESIRRRLEKQQTLLEERENLSPPQRARRVRDQGADSKLTALHECLKRAEFYELTDGRGKLLIFTEHRDTLNHLRHHLEKWGFTTTQIHGGMNPHERKRAQEEFRTTKQICVATEAAGEGINLQFCRLMLNYDLPWNPTRLEQRLGRIHRIGQERDVHAFNFVAAQSEEGQDIVEGRILARLLEKLDQFVKSCAEIGLKVEPRADGLWRIEHVLADLRSDRLESVRHLGKPEPSDRKLTFHKDRLDDDQHLDAVLFGPGHPLYAAVDERLNEKLVPLTGGMALYVDAVAEKPYRLHFFEITVRGQDTKGEPQTLFAELVAVRQNLMEPDVELHDAPSAFSLQPSAFSIVPADCLLDLPAFPDPPESLPGSPRPLDGRGVRGEGTGSGEGPGVRDAIADLIDDLDPEITRQSEIAAENIVVAYETARGWETERVGHLKIGFDVRSLGPADPQTGYRDPLTSIRRIEVKGRKRGQTIRLTTNEWYKAVQLGDSYWLYMVWDPLGLPAPQGKGARQAGKPSPEPLRIQNPAKHLDHAKKEIVAARYFDIPAAAVEQAANAQR